MVPKYSQISVHSILLLGTLLILAPIWIIFASSTHDSYTITAGSSDVSTNSASGIGAGGGSAITATENRDYIATKKIPAKNKDQYKKDFIEKIYKKDNLRLITGREAARLQGFPDKFDLDENDKLAKKQFGNAVPVNVVNSVIKEIMKQGFIK